MKDGVRFGIGIVLCFAIVAADIVLLSYTDVPMWMFWAILVVSIIVAFLPVLSFRPTVATVENGMLDVRGPFVNVSVPLTSITGVELRTDFKFGFRVWGYGGIRRFSGEFSNREFGTYTLAADSTIHAYVVLRHAKGILVFNSVSEDITRTLYGALTGQGIPSTVVPMDHEEASKASRRHKCVIAGVTIALVAIVVAVVALLLSAGYVDVSMDEDGVKVDAFMTHEKIAYDDIGGIELVEDMDYGTRVGGYAGSDFLSGNFRNNELGKYTLAVHRSTDLCIVVHRTSGSAVVFNLTDEDSTRTFYEELRGVMDATYGLPNIDTLGIRCNYNAFSL